MAKIRLLALDIDGTLVNSQDELTDATCAALAAVAAAGVLLVLATGRRYSRTLPLVRQLGIAAPVVSASGALIKRPADHATLYQAGFAPGTLEAWLAFVSQRGYEAVLYSDSYDQGFDFYCPRAEVEQAELADYLALNPGCARLWPRLMSAPPPGVFAGFAIGQRAEMVDLRDALAAALPEQLTTHVLQSPRYLGHMCEIAPKGVTKWSGVQQVAKLWGISAEEICAVGDDVNDIPMIEAAGLGVAMGNAQDEVKQVAQRIAPTHDADGLVQVADWVLSRA